MSEILNNLLDNKREIFTKQSLKTQTPLARVWVAFVVNIFLRCFKGF